MNPAEVYRWYPLLRRLYAAGWRHVRYGSDTAVEHVWERNRNALNAQRITWNLSGAMATINGRTFTTTELTRGEAFAALGLIGAFNPAPAPVYRPVLSAVK